MQKFPDDNLPNIFTPPLFFLQCYNQPVYVVTKIEHSILKKTSLPLFEDRYSDIVFY